MASSTLSYKLYTTGEFGTTHIDVTVNLSGLVTGSIVPSNNDSYYLIQTADLTVSGSTKSLIYRTVTPTSFPSTSKNTTLTLDLKNGGGTTYETFEVVIPNPVAVSTHVNGVTKLVTGSLCEGQVVAWDTVSSNYFAIIRNISEMVSIGSSIYENIITSIVYDMTNFFASNASSIINIQSWDTSNVTTMAYMFSNSSNFDKDISNWDVSKVVNMTNMFYSSNSFNQDISGWDVSGVITMDGMFYLNTAFNQDIGGWVTSSVTSMNAMFRQNPIFDQDIDGWDVSNVKDMQSMFYLNTAFNQYIGSWDVSKVKTMFEMFRQSTMFNQSLDTWSFDEVTDLTGFLYQSKYNVPITWVLPKVKTLELSISGITTFNSTVDITAPEAVNLTRMLGGCGILNSTVALTIPKAQILDYLFAHCGVFNKTLTLDLPSALSLRYMFEHCFLMNSPITLTNTSNVRDFGFMFDNAAIFNTTLVLDVSGGVIFDNMFLLADDFNQDISGWDVSNAIDMGGMFTSARFFNQDISSWDVSNVTDMNKMFEGAVSFNQDISSWDMSSVENISNMFRSCNFNTNINNWDVSNVNNMNNLFLTNTSFDQPLNNWNVSNVTNFSGTFARCIFNQDISGWNTMSATNMSTMFDRNAQFAQDISGWDVSNVTNMSTMFNIATSMTSAYDLRSWDVHNIASQPSNFKTSISLIAPTWGTNGRLKYTGGILGHSNVQYTPITDGGRTVIDVEIFLDKMLDSGSLAITVPGTYYTLITSSPIAFTAGSDVSFIVRATGNTVTATDTKTTITMALDYTSITDVTLTTDIDDPIAVITHANTVTKSMPIDVDQERQRIGFDASGGNNYYLYINFPKGTSPPTSKYSLKSTMLRVPGFENYLITSKVTSFRSLIYSGSYNPVITSWDTSNVNNMSQMSYNNPTFNQEIGNWDTSKVRTMEQTFYGASAFDGDITNWDVSNVSTFSNMFYNATSFNSDLAWDPANANNMEYMFHGASTFDGDVSGWDTSNVENMSYMFKNAGSFVGTGISTWNVSKVETMKEMFYAASSFNTSINEWDTLSSTIANVTDMYRMFYNASSYDQDMDSWSISPGTDITQLFQGCSSLDGDFSNWDMTGFDSLDTLFSGCSSFTGIGLDTWTINGVESLLNMFRHCIVFDADISSWDTSSVTNFSSMFNGASVFNQDIDGWDTTSATNFSSMFFNAALFNQDLSGWDVSSAEDMSYMFYNASAFDGDIINWDTSSVENMSNMFAYTASFNQDITGWDISKSSDISYMFRDASVFNQDIGSWKVSGVITTAGFEWVFYNATNFNQDLSSWNVGIITTPPNSFFSSGSAFHANSAFKPMWGVYLPCEPYSIGTHIISSPVIRPKDPAIHNNDIFDGINIIDNVVPLNSTITNVTVSSIAPISNLSLSIETITPNVDYKLVLDSGLNIGIQSTYIASILVETTLGNVIQYVSVIVDGNPEYDGSNVITVDLGNAYRNTDYVSSSPVIDDGFSLNGETISTITFLLEDEFSTPIVNPGVTINTTTFNLEITMASFLPVNVGYVIKDIVVTDDDSEQVTLSNPTPFITFTYVDLPTTPPVLTSDVKYWLPYQIVDGTSTLPSLIIQDFDNSYINSRVIDNGYNITNVDILDIRRIILNPTPGTIENVENLSEFQYTIDTSFSYSYVYPTLTLTDIGIGPFIIEFDVTYSDGINADIHVTVYTTISVQSLITSSQDLEVNGINDVKAFLETKNLSSIFIEGTPTEDIQSEIIRMVSESPAFLELATEDSVKASEILSELTKTISISSDKSPSQSAIVLTNGSSINIIT